MYIWPTGLMPGRIATMFVPYVVACAGSGPPYGGRPVVERWPQQRSEARMDMARAQASVAADTIDYEVHGRTVKVMARPAESDQLTNWFEPTRSAQLVEFRITTVPVEPTTFSLPGTPDGLVLEMDEHGDGHLFAVGEKRIALGSEGMWWIVTRLIEALEDPQTVSQWPRFLTLGEKLGGPAAQAALRYDDNGVCVVWRRLSSGVVEDLLSWQELNATRAEGWLNSLRPILEQIEERGVHHRRLLPARTAEKWARVLER